MLKEAASYESIPGQDLQTYFFKKVGKLNKLKLELSEDKLVDFVARGLHDERIRTTVLSTRCKTLNELNNCLAIFREPDTKAKEAKREIKIGKEKSRDDKKNACYKCGKVGHRRADCPDLKRASDVKVAETQKSEANNKPICGYCHKVLTRRFGKSVRSM